MVNKNEVGGGNAKFRALLGAFGGVCLMAGLGIIQITSMLIRNPIYDMTSLIAGGFGVIAGVIAIYIAYKG